MFFLRMNVSDAMSSINACQVLQILRVLSTSVLTSPIRHFTVVCLMTWPRIGSEAGSDLVLIQTSLLFICK